MASLATDTNTNDNQKTIDNNEKTIEKILERQFTEEERTELHSPNFA